ncbi:MAG TPA: hypothetical protein VLF43_00845 [Candidatus Saccharimonadales bacterium]|nr:hypothetical protein [Candidatus Saccharimonadales bacterium]
MSNMVGNNNTRQYGYIDALLIPLIIAGLLLIGALAFGGWAYSSRADYKDNSDQKAAAAAEQAVEDTKVSEQAKYAEEAKNPLKTFVGPSAYASVTLQYPKTWSAYVLEASTTTPLDAYFHPDFVPNVGDNDNAYALRMQIVSKPYNTVVDNYDGEVKQNKVTAVPYSLPKVPSVTGIRLTGQITTKKQGSMIILPVRNVTLLVWTESADFIPDLDNIILPNLVFSP